ncbi:helix-turn-helix domain-containing protein [uncultured Parabacteroides sp.]|uniref:helix-turn-helix domain-containing protein n=1 Tax=uncultured Parabacteroides sp. TaxID=512312 RepID=UPI00258F775A|nr:helix-turn-helix domain-containing protein [uncultured Parabacteroides sp.]
MDFHVTIKERRSLLGLTQQDLADYSGVSLRIIKSIEAGTANPSIGTLTKIAEALGLEICMTVKGVNK